MERSVVSEHFRVVSMMTSHSLNAYSIRPRVHASRGRKLQGQLSLKKTLAAMLEESKLQELVSAFGQRVVLDKTLLKMMLSALQKQTITV